jgi:hypothetical protein
MKRFGHVKWLKNKKGTGDHIAAEKYKCKRPFGRPEHGW